MEVTGQDVMRIAKAETYAIPYVQKKEDLKQLTIQEYVEKVIKACEEVDAHFGDKIDFVGSDNAKVLNEEELRQLRADAYTLPYVQAHYNVSELTATEFLQKVIEAGNTLMEKYVDKEEL